MMAVRAAAFWPASRSSASQNVAHQTGQHEREEVEIVAVMVVELWS